MNIRPISEWTLYKHRFLIAYTALGILVILLLGMYAWQIPPGLSHAEQQSVITSHNLSFVHLPTPQQIIDLPYHAMQKLSVDLLGLTPYGVRLPSMVFAALTALCISLIVKRWFKTNIAIVTSVLLITSSWFLALGRLGAPDIMVPFWTSVLILSATYVSQQTKRWHIWKALFGVAAALSLYTPYMAYLFIAAVIATAAQPHLRYLIRQSSKAGLAIGVFFFVLILAPLGWSAYNDTSILRKILALPAAIPEPLQFGKDLLQAISNLANPFNNGGGEMVLPLLSIAVLTIILIGGIKLLSDYHSVRAYVLLIWVALLIPIIGFNPGDLTVLFVPSMLVLAIGINLIVRYWYRLFPLNPYARVFGFIPLFFLIGAVVQFNYQRYAYFMAYSQQANQTFSTDAFLVQRQSGADKLPANAPLTIVVPADTVPLYKVIADRRPNTQVQDINQPISRPGQHVVAESEVHKIAPALGPQASLIVNDRKENSLRFRIYQR